MALVTLTDTQKSSFRVLDNQVFVAGRELDWHEKAPYQNYGNYTWILKGDWASQVERNHTSIKTRDFQNFVSRTQGIVYVLTGRLIFERETVFVFSDHTDLCHFKLTFAGNKSVKD